MGSIKLLAEILGERPGSDSLVRAIGPVSRPSLGMSIGHLPRLPRSPQAAPARRPPGAPPPPPERPR